MNRGFSIIELLVSISIFSLLITIVVGVLVGSVKVQTDILANQRLAGEIRYVVENISRIGMLAITDTEADCLDEGGKTYESTDNKLKFIDYRNKCNFYELRDGTIYRKLDDMEYPLTSSEFNVQKFKVEINEDPHERVLVFIEMGIEGSDVWLHAQTTFSKRTLK